MIEFNALFSGRKIAITKTHLTGCIPADSGFFKFTSALLQCTRFDMNIADVQQN